MNQEVLAHWRRAAQTGFLDASLGRASLRVSTPGQTSGNQLEETGLPAFSSSRVGS